MHESVAKKNFLRYNTAVMSKMKIDTRDMTVGTPWKLIAKFAFPLLLGNILQQLYNTADTIIVGNFGGATVEESANAMSAVGVSFPIFFMMSSLFMGLGMGSTVMTAQYKGANMMDRVQDTLNTMYSVVLLFAVPLGIAGIFLSRPLLALINVSESIMPMAVAYLTVILGGMVFTFGYNVNAGVLQGMGDSKTSLLFLGVATVMNIILDLVFVLLLHMGALGVGIATIIAQACAWLFGVFYINKKYKGVLKIKIFQIKIDGTILKQAMKLGLPTGIQNMLFSIGVLAISGLINSYDDFFVGGFTAANKIDTFAFMPIVSFSNAATTFVGQNIGAGRIDRVNTGTRSAIIMAIIVSMGAAALIFPFSDFLMSLFNPTAAVISAGTAYLRRILPFYWMLSILFIINGVLRGAGSAIVPMISSIASLWLARVPAAYLMAMLGKENIFWCYAIGWLPGLLISGGYYIFGKWRNCSITGVGKPPE